MAPGGGLDKEDLQAELTKILEGTHFVDMPIVCQEDEPMFKFKAADEFHYVLKLRWVPCENRHVLVWQ